jgi:hypothetical protein
MVGRADRKAGGGLACFIFRFLRRPQKAAGEAVGASVRQSLAGASDAAAKALGEAAKPVIGSLSGVVQAASDAEGSMRNAGAWFAWKWVAVAAGGLVGVCLVAYASLAWQLHQVSSLRDEKAELAADVAQMQVNVSALGEEGRAHRHDHMRRAAVHRGQQQPRRRRRAMEGRQLEQQGNERAARDSKGVLMKKLNDLLARIPEMQARAKQRAEREPLPGKPLPKNVVQLPLMAGACPCCAEWLPTFGPVWRDR